MMFTFRYVSQAENFAAACRRRGWRARQSSTHVYVAVEGGTEDEARTVAERYTLEKVDGEAVA